MFKKKFLFVACNGYPWTEGNLDGLGFECIKLRTSSALLVAPRAISLSTLRKALALIRLHGYEARIRPAERLDPLSRNVIVVDYGVSHTYGYINTEWGQLKLIAFYKKLESKLLRFCIADKYQVVTDEEKLYERKFPTFLPADKRKAFMHEIRTCSPRSKFKVLAKDELTVYGNTRNYCVAVALKKHLISEDDRYLTKVYI